MTIEDDLDYLEKRAREEYELAEQALDGCARMRHEEMARMYEQRLIEARASRPGPAAAVPTPA